MTKKILSFVLVALMALALVPMSVFAKTETGTKENETYYPAATLEPGCQYLIGVVSGTDVKLLKNLQKDAFYLAATNVADGTASSVTLDASNDVIWEYDVNSHFMSLSDNKFLRAPSNYQLETNTEDKATPWTYSGSKLKTNRADDGSERYLEWYSSGTHFDVETEASASTVILYLVYAPATTIISTISCSSFVAPVYGAGILDEAIGIDETDYTVTGTWAKKDDSALGMTFTDTTYTLTVNGRIKDGSEKTFANPLTLNLNGDINTVIPSDGKTFTFTKDYTVYNPSIGNWVEWTGTDSIPSGIPFLIGKPSGSGEVKLLPNTAHAADSSGINPVTATVSSDEFSLAAGFSRDNVLWHYDSTANKIFAGDVGNNSIYLATNTSDQINIADTSSYPLNNFNGQTLYTEYKYSYSYFSYLKFESNVFKCDYQRKNSNTSPTVSAGIKIYVPAPTVELASVEFRDDTMPDGVHAIRYLANGTNYTGTAIDDFGFFVRIDDLMTYYTEIGCHKFFTGNASSTAVSFTIIINGIKDTPAAGTETTIVNSSISVYPFMTLGSNTYAGTVRVEEIRDFADASNNHDY